jgi:hypothetical protein
MLVNVKGASEDYEIFWTSKDKDLDFAWVSFEELRFF